MGPLVPQERAPNASWHQHVVDTQVCKGPGTAALCTSIPGENSQLA